jgi:uncharacterized protein (DUF1778 family)
MKKGYITARVTEETRLRLIAIAKTERRSVSQILQFMIEEALSKKAKKP